MQENEFEKQLKKMMDGFHVSPSISVWEKISRRLNEKRRRKTPFIFLLAVGLATAGYFIYNVTGNTNQHINTVAINKDAGNAINKNLKDSNYATIKQNSTTKRDSVASLNKNKTRLQYDKTLYSKESVSKENLKSDLVINEKIPVNEKIITQTQKKNVTELPQQNNTKQAATKSNAPALNNKSVNENSEKQSLTVADANVATINQSNDDKNLTSNLLKPDSIIAAQQGNNSSMQKTYKGSKNKSYKTSKWQIGVTAFYGKSNLTGSLVDLSKSTATYLDFSRGPVNASDTISAKAYPFSASNSYTFGAVIQKKIFKNGFISTGLNFVHLSAKASINKKIDSSFVVRSSNNINNFYTVNTYYRAGETKTFISKYNFIELPVNFQQYIFHSKQTALFYNAGFTIRQLISSDALIYNPADNVYFSKDDLLRKTQFQINGGLSFEIKTGSKNSVFVGPQFNYSLSNFLKNASAGNFHFINYGVHAGFLLHKK